MNEKIRSRRWGALWPALMVAGGVAVAVYFVKFAPRARRAPPPRMPRLVETASVAPTQYTIRVAALGLVRPAQSVTLYPRIGGAVTELSAVFLPGGMADAGEWLVRLDPADYDLAIRQRAAELEKARGDLALEEGQQAVAANEFRLLDRPADPRERSLALREPQLARARAAVSAAEAALRQAELNRERTELRAPFAGVIRARTVSPGSAVTTATPLGEIAGTDAAWIETTIPQDVLRRLRIPGAAARVTAPAVWGAERFRTGTVIRALGDLESAGRLARVLVEVDDPFARRPGPADRSILRFEQMVEVELEGETLAGIIALDSAWLRDGGKIWIRNDDNRLEIRPVTPIYRDARVALLADGLRAGERVVTSELTIAVPGMELREADRP